MRFIDIDNMPDNMWWDALTDNEKRQIRAWFLKAPTVEARLVEHSCWMPKYDLEHDKCAWTKKYHPRWFYCVNCGITRVFDQGTDVLPNFCDNCGAIMDKNAEAVHKIQKELKVKRTKERNGNADNRQR